jgi:hypothetical protein
MMLSGVPTYEERDLATRYVDCGGEISALALDERSGKRLADVLRDLDAHERHTLKRATELREGLLADLGARLLARKLAESRELVELLRGP